MANEELALSQRSVSGETFRNIVDSTVSYLTAIGAPEELIGAIGYSGYTAGAGLR